MRTDEDALTRSIIALAMKYGRYGYRRITVELGKGGWEVSQDRVQRIWRREGLKVPHKQRPRRRLWLNDGSCMRLRPERRNHVWSYDFVSAMTHDGRTLRMLVLIDEYTRECLAIRVARRLGSYEVIETLADVMLWRGIPEHIRSDNGPDKFNPVRLDSDFRFLWGLPAPAYELRPRGDAGTIYNALEGNPQKPNLAGFLGGSSGHNDPNIGSMIVPGGQTHLTAGLLQ